MSKGRITKEQLSKSLLDFISQNAIAPTFSGDLKFKKNSTTIQSSVNQVAIGIDGYDKSKDLLMVYKNSVYLEEDVVYTVTSDSLYIQKMNGNWNETGTSVFNFVVIKGGVISTPVKVLNALALELESEETETDSTTSTGTVTLGGTCLVSPRGSKITLPSELSGNYVVSLTVSDPSLDHPVSVWVTEKAPGYFIARCSESCRVDWIIVEI